VLRHPRLAHAIVALRPGTKPLVDFVVEDNGSGPTLRDGSMVNPPTQAEVDALTAAQLDAAQASKFAMDMTSKMLLTHENRIRVLESKQPLTAAQFKALLKSLA
jgi:hypothetical protein